MPFVPLAPVPLAPVPLAPVPPEQPTTTYAARVAPKRTRIGRIWVIGIECFILGTCHSQDDHGAVRQLRNRDFHDMWHFATKKCGSFLTNRKKIHLIFSFPCERSKRSITFARLSHLLLFKSRAKSRLRLQITLEEPAWLACSARDASFQSRCWAL